MSLNSAMNVFNLQLNDSALALVLLSLKKFSIQFFVLTPPNRSLEFLRVVRQREFLMTDLS